MSFNLSLEYLEWCTKSTTSRPVWHFKIYLMNKSFIIALVLLALKKSEISILPFKSFFLKIFWILLLDFCLRTTPSYAQDFLLTLSSKLTLSRARETKCGAHMEITFLDMALTSVFLIYMAVYRIIYRKMCIFIANEYILIYIYIKLSK